jgi:stage III sporulation protein AG
VTEQNTLVFSQGNSGGSDTPVVVSQTSPEIAGVLVLADGANDPVLKEKLVQAVETVLDLPAYKVIVLPRKGG